MHSTIYPHLVQFRAPEGLLSAAREAASEEGQSLSEFIRSLLRARLREDDQPAQEGGKR